MTKYFKITVEARAASSPTKNALSSDELDTSREVEGLILATYEFNTVKYHHSQLDTELMEWLDKELLQNAKQQLLNDV